MPFPSIRAAVPNKLGSDENSLLSCPIKGHPGSSSIILTWCALSEFRTNTVGKVPKFERLPLSEVRRCVFYFRKSGGAWFALLKLGLATLEILVIHYIFFPFILFNISVASLTSSGFTSIDASNNSL